MFTLKFVIPNAHNAGAEEGFIKLFLLQFIQLNWNEERQNCLRGWSLSQVIDFLFVSQFNGCPFVSVPHDWWLKKFFFFIPRDREKTWLDKISNQICTYAWVDNSQTQPSFFLLRVTPNGSLLQYGPEVPTLVLFVARPWVSRQMLPVNYTSGISACPVRT